MQQKILLLVETVTESTMRALHIHSERGVTVAECLIKFDIELN